MKCVGEGIRLVDGGHSRLLARRPRGEVARWLVPGLFLLLLLACAGPQKKTLEWRQQLPSPNDLAGWNLYASPVPGGPYTLLAKIPYENGSEHAHEAVLKPQEGQKAWYFVVTSVDREGNESAPSNEASAPVSRFSGTIRVKITTTPPASK